MRKFFSKKIFFGVKFFSLIIGSFIFILFFSITFFTDITKKLDLKILDLDFYLKEISSRRVVQEGVSEVERNPDISDDIIIVGIDFRSLGKFGKWPFPRYRHADFLDSLSRIKKQEERERAVFLDIFFIEPDMEAPYDDALLAESIADNGRVYLETILDESALPDSIYDDYFTRQKILIERSGDIKNISGEWQKISPYYGMQPPLQPFARAAAGYGHANFSEDFDKTYRRQGMISRLSILEETLNIEDLTVGCSVDGSSFQRMGWTDHNGRDHYFKIPGDEKSLEEFKNFIRKNSPPSVKLSESGEKVEYYTVNRYREKFIPSATLSLALGYFNKNFSDIEIKAGEYIKIPSPMKWDADSGQWKPYELTVREAKYDREGNIVKDAVTRIQDEIVIPIDEEGKMLINFAGYPSTAGPGGHQTFPVRSYSAYASSSPGADPAKWPSTKALGNKIIMTGAFAHGMASDEKTTPYGLMYGVEIHANALNTILMNRFLKPVPAWINILTLFASIFLTAFIVSRFSTMIAFFVSFSGIFLLFMFQNHLFDDFFYMLSFPPSALGILFTFILVVVYRVMTEEKDKKRIKNMFGKYVCPAFVDQMISSGESPELGGIDRELTVLFSDIRGFTTLSESMTPQDLVDHLNEYLTAMTNTIMKFYGTLDKYVGDEIMCFWGAPIPQENHALLACKCALKQMDDLRKLNENWVPERRINIGIGLNSGIMTVGNMGSEGRMNYTLMGDNVNLGARLEGTNKEYGTNVIISEFTYEKVKDDVVVRELDNIRVKGKYKPVLIYELLDVKGGYETP